jgi:hypothetical protein
VDLSEKLPMRFHRILPSVSLVAAFFVLGLTLSRPSQVVESLTSASTAPAWSWQGTQFAQGVRCERIFHGPFFGPSFRQVITGPYRSYAKQRKLKFLEFNMLNLFERDFALMGQSKDGRIEKSEQQRNALAKIIQKSDADVMVWVEVENQKAAELFSQKYLADRYDVFLVEGNDSRGIDIAMLVKKDLPFEVEYRSLKDLTANGGQVFSRDLPIAVFRRQDLSDHPPEFVLIGTHYKSKRGDDLGEAKRTIQASATAEAMASLRSEFGAELTILLAGDFNNQVHDSKEFVPLWSLNLKDSHDLSPNPIPRDQRGTHFYFNPDGRREVNQIDGILVSAADQIRVESAKILPHLDEAGNELPWPKTYPERETRPSDHLATEVVIEFGQ